VLVKALALVLLTVVVVSSVFSSYRLQELPPTYVSQVRQAYKLGVDTLAVPTEETAKDTTGARLIIKSEKIIS
jgi:hypothetical protein